MNLSDYYFDLPEEHIAKYPPKDRDGGRLMVVQKCWDKDVLEHHSSLIVNLPHILQKGDLLVINNTKVIPARIFGKRRTGGKVEIFVLSYDIDKNTAIVMAKPSRKLKVSETIFLDNGDNYTLDLIEKKEDGQWLVVFEQPIAYVLEKCGQMPIPPYLQREAEEMDKDRYQTVFAHHEGAVAAPTAGLHLSEKLVEKLVEKGVEFAEITLHVGIGTFRNLRDDDIERGTLHHESFVVSEKCVEAILACKKRKGRLIAVGTTVTRTLESVFQQKKQMVPMVGQTDIFIREGFEFSVVDGLITNFHLPQSSLLMLVSAICGRERILQIYKQAVAEKYRFFSYGDAMLLLP